MADRPHTGGKPEWEPTEDERFRAETLAGYGVPHKMIALLCGVSEPTLRKHLSDVLDLGEAKATSQVAQTLYMRATKGNDLGAAIFWLKARAGWREKHPDNDENDKSVTIVIKGGLPDAD